MTRFQEEYVLSVAKEEEEESSRGRTFERERERRERGCLVIWKEIGLKGKQIVAIEPEMEQLSIQEEREKDQTRLDSRVISPSFFPQ